MRAMGKDPLSARQQWLRLGPRIGSKRAACSLQTLRVTKPHKQSLFEQPNLSPIEAIGDAMRLSFVCRDFSLHQSKLQVGQCTR
jgi:ribosome assembly protein YihI (activator of Der GTPase)